MNDNPLVSIIIPAYNVERYIKDAVDSAIGQTYKNIEIIVVDDGSTDGTKKELESYIKNNKIIYLYQKNKGLSGARNAGINQARGEYIALLDADDMFRLTKIEKQIFFLNNNPDCDFCYTDVEFFRDGNPGKILKSYYKYHSGKVLKYLFISSFINPSTLFFRKDAVYKFGTFNESFKRAEDLEYYIRASLNGAEFCLVNEPLFLSRIRNYGNLQSDYVLMQDSILRIFNNAKSRLSNDKIKEYNLLKIIDKRKLKLALAFLEAKNKKDCRDILKSVEGFKIVKLFVYFLMILPSFIFSYLINGLFFIKRFFLYR